MSLKPKWVAGAAGLCMAMLSWQASAHDEPVVGSLVGAGIGAAVAGPPGAAVGAVIGAAIGSDAAHQTDHNKHTHVRYRQYSRARIDPPYRGHVHYVEPVRHGHAVRQVETVRYVNGVESARVDCKPQRADYRPRVVHRDARTKVSRTATPKAGMKKVCRYVPAGRKVTTAAGPRSAPAPAPYNPPLS